MSKELVVKEEKDLVTKEKIVNYLQVFGLAGQLSDNETKQFVEIASAYNLNPFKREIYCIPYGTGSYRKLSIITGYESYIKRAEESGLLDGWNVETTQDGAKITIHRKDFKFPFIHEVLFNEYKQDNKIWKEKPKTMIRKVAIAQGFRMCFSGVLGGMPYTADELPDNMTQEKNVTPKYELPKVEPKAEVKKEVVVDEIPDFEVPKTVVPEVVAPAKQKGDLKGCISALDKCKSISAVDDIIKAVAKREFTHDEISMIETKILEVKSKFASQELFA